MAKPKSKPIKTRNPYALHSKRRKAGVHADKRKTAKAKQKEEETALTEDVDLFEYLDEDYEQI